MEYCLILPKSPSADGYRCRGLGGSGIWYLRNKGAFSSLWIHWGWGVRNNSITVRRKLKGFSLLYSPARNDPVAGRAPNPRQIGLTVCALLSPLFNKGWGLPSLRLPPNITRPR